MIAKICFDSRRFLRNEPLLNKGAVIVIPLM